MTDTSPLLGLLADALELGASDLHLHSGSRVRMRIRGELVVASEAPLSSSSIEQLARDVLSPEQINLLRSDGQIDFGITMESTGRVRGNMYRQQRGLDVVFRLIPREIPTFASLRLPSQLTKLTEYRNGLVLVTGPAGSGKSSTLAALIDMLNTERRDHILTLEDPVEFVHPSKQCIVSQREIGRHTESFAKGLRAGLREDPDVLLVGELRDLASISLAVTAAETGHLVLATLHTRNTTEAVDRMIHVFPPERQGLIRTKLGDSLRAVISQKLIGSADGTKRHAALEILFVTPAVRGLIRENKTFHIPSTIQLGTVDGMCLFDHSLSELVRRGAITREVALRHAEDPQRL